MNIQEYADVLNLELGLTRYPNQNNRWVARFESCETKDGADDCMLTSTYGNGSDPSSAIGDYVDQIKGKLLVVNASSDALRREYLVPQTLTAR